METAGIRPVKIVEIRNPFQPEERTGEILLAPLPGEFLDVCMKRAGMDASGYAIRLNDELIEAGEEAFHLVRPGDRIICSPAAGGGIMRIIAMVAVMALTAALTGGLGDIAEAVVMGYMGITSVTTAAIVAGAIAIGGNMLISAFMGPGAGSGTNSPGLTYDPNGPKTLAQPGTPVPKAYGTMGWGGNIISSYVDQDGKDEYLNVLVAFGFGQATSVKDIFLNQKPITSYPDLLYNVRLGTNTQTPIPGFDTIRNVYPQEVDLLAANPPTIITGTGTNVSGLQIAVKFPGGLMRTDSGGNPKEVSLAYKVEVAPSGTGLWTTPIFPRTMTDVYTTDANGYRHYPYWVVMPTDRFAGSGIVYSTDTNVSAHTPGESWSMTQTVTVYDVNNTSSSHSQTFTGEWQPTTNSNLDLMSVTDWWGGWRIVSDMTDQSFYDVVNVYGLTVGKWDCRITKYGAGPHNQPIPAGDGYMTDPHYTADAWLWDVTEMQFADLAYPNFCLLGIRALATSQLNGADITVQATWTHDIGADTVLPATLAGFEHDNPAIVAYDIIMNPLYGMASSTPNLAVDVPAFVNWATFCDELVPNSTFAGAWSSGTNYTQGQTVSYGGSYYVSRVDGNLNITPGSNAFYWLAAAGAGALQRRFVFAGVFDNNGTNAWQCLQQVALMSRAQITQEGNTYSVWIDAPTDITQVFTEANIVKDSYSSTFVAMDDRATLIEASFADAQRNWRTDLPVSVMTAATINGNIQPKITRTTLLGCTNRDQAWQWAYFNLLSTETLLRTAKWKAAIESVSCKLGSVVGVQQRQWSLGGRIQAGSTATSLIIDRTDLPAFTGSGWQVGVQHPVYAVGTAMISSMASAGTGVYLVTFTGTLPAGRILRIAGPGGIEATVQAVTQVSGANGNSLTMGSVQGAFSAGQVVTLYDYDRLEVQNVSALSGLTLTTSAFSQVPTPDAPWFYAQTAGGAGYKTFRVTGIRQSGDFNMEISGLEYNPAIYTDLTPNYGQIVSFPTVNAAVSNLTLKESISFGAYRTLSNHKKATPTQAIIVCSWDNGPNTSSVDVWGQVDGGNWNLLQANASKSGYTFAATTGDVWSIAVVGKDQLGVQSSYNGAPTQTITVQGTGEAPGGVTGFTGNLQTGTLLLSWTAPVRAATYELRYNADPNNNDWNSGTLIATGLTATSYALTGPNNGLYMVKAISSSYVESVSVATWGLVGNSSQLTGTGSIAPGQSLLVNVASVTYDSTSGMCSCTLSMPAQSLLRSDGTTYSVPAGTMTWTKVLAPSTTYYLYSDLRISDATMHIAGGTTATGGDTPVVPPTTPSAALALLACADGFYQGPIITITTPSTAGTGGGSSGGGPGICPDGRELVVTRERGRVPVSTVLEGEHIRGFCFKTAWPVYRKVIRVRHTEAWSWYLVNGYRMSPLDPVWIAGEWRMPYQVGTFDAGQGERIQVTVEADEYDQQNYYLVGLVGQGEPLLIHNQRISPC